MVMVTGAVQRNDASPAPENARETKIDQKS